MNFPPKVTILPIQTAKEYMKRVFIDMDNVLVDFQSGLDQVSEEVKAEYAGRLDEIPGLFAKMKPMEGAIEAVHELQKHYDLFILSTAPWKNPSAWSDKVEWVTKYLDDVFHKRLIISHRKDLCQGDYLIDDRGKNGTSEFTGEWIQFGSEKFPDWESVLKYLANCRLEEYLAEISREKLLTLEEEMALVKAIQQKGGRLRREGTVCKEQSAICHQCGGTVSEKRADA